MKNIITIRRPNGRKKEVEFNPDKHSVVAGNLTERLTLRIVGQVIKVESR